LLLAFCVSMLVLNLVWHVIGFIIFKVQGFKAIARCRYLKIRKLSYYRGTNPHDLRSVIVWCVWGFAPVVCLMQSLVIQNSVIQPFNDVTLWGVIVVICSLIPMFIVPKEYAIKLVTSNGSRTCGK
jgi:hypothetical protein